MSHLDRLKIRAVSLLRWSEKYTKTDMLYLSKGGFWLSLGQGVAILSGLVLSVAFANLLPPEVFGQYRFVIAAGAIIGAFALTGMGTAIVQAVARGYEGSLRAGFSQSLRWSIGTTALALGASAYYYLNDNLTLALSFLPIAIATPLILSSSLYQGFLNGKKDFRRVTFYNIAHKLIHLIALVTTITLTHNPIIIVAVYFATEALVALTLYLLTLRAYKPSTETDFDTLSYSKHLSVMGGIKMIGLHIDKVLVFQQLGAVQLAIYAFALAPVTQIKAIDQTIASVAYPKLSERSYEEIQKSLPRKVFLLMGAMAGVTLVYILSAPFIFYYLFPQYLESIPFTQAYALTLIFAPHILFMRALTAHKKTTYLYIGKICIPAFNLVLLLILLPMYGIWGAVYAIISTNVFATLLSLYLFLKH